MADINSNLPVIDLADGATGSATPSEATLVGGTDGTNLRPLSTSSTGILNAQLPNLVATGTLTGTGQTVNLTLQGTSSVNVDVSGSGFVGTIVVLENTPSTARVLGTFALNSSAVASSITANGNYRVVGVPTSGTITVQFSAYTSGSATINIYGSTATFIVQPYSANAANVLVTSYTVDGSGNSIGSTSGALNVNVNGSALPTGAATAANQVTQETTLSTIATNTLVNGVPLTYAAPTTASVGITSTLILAANGSRRGLYLSNTTPYQISLAFGNAASYQYGITLFPGEKFWMDQYSFSTQAVYAISSVATYIGIQEID